MIDKAFIKKIYCYVLVDKETIRIQGDEIIFTTQWNNTWYYNFDGHAI